MFSLEPPSSNADNMVYSYDITYMHSLIHILNFSLKYLWWVLLDILSSKFCVTDSWSLYLASNFEINFLENLGTPILLQS